MKKKFAKAFDKMDDQLKGQEAIDFKKSSVNKTSPVKKIEKEERQHRTNRMQTYLTDDEFLQVAETMKPLEQPAKRIRKLLMADVAKRKKDRKKEK